MALWMICTLPCRTSVAPKRGAIPNRPLPSWTVKASNRRKKGARIDPAGYDAGKQIKGKKRHVLVDTQGLVLQALVHPADIQDRDGGLYLLATRQKTFPKLMTLFADGAYQGPCFGQGVAALRGDLTVVIVKRPAGTKGFTVLPKRWIVERSLAWLNRCR